MSFLLDFQVKVMKNCLNIDYFPRVRFACNVDFDFVI